MVEIKVQRGVFINLPAQDIFDYLCRLENMVDWASTTIAMRKVTPDPMGAGTVISGTFRFLGKWINVVFEVVEYSPGHCLALKSIAGSPSSLFHYQLEARENGGTILSEEAVMQVMGNGQEPEHSVITSAVTRQLEYDLQTLKEILEAGVSFF